MKATGAYTYSLGFTSQFYFCSLPLRLDTYSRCGFGCRYCFSAARGGDKRGGGLKVASPDVIARRLDRIARGRGQGVIDELLARRQPLHIGGMNDPLPPAEQQHRATLKVLDRLAKADYPALISVKGVELLDDRYLAALATGRFILQISLSSMDEQLIHKIDAGAPGPTRRLQAVRDASAAGVPVSIRIQPLLPSREEDAREVIQAAAEAGASHVAVEHLKLGVESWCGTDALSEALGIDVAEEFRRRSAMRVGRKWILPAETRLPRQLALRDDTRRLGMTYAAADNDLLLLSDGGCCCSGADLIAGFTDYYRYNYLEAARRGIEHNRICLSSLDSAWRPAGSIARQVNSRSRIRAMNGTGAGVSDYVERNWSGRPNGSSPTMFWGVEATEDREPDGSCVYRFTPEARDLYAGTRRDTANRN